MSWGSTPSSGKDFSSRHSVRTGSGAYPASEKLATGGSFPGSKAAGAWSWSPTSSAVVKDAWSYTSKAHMSPRCGA